ncbi:MAG: TIGR02301 family protein, partial [Bradyrhizobium sp.]|nr:TIGR02301 family protein [Bradyrhizobium sp.]
MTPVFPIFAKRLFALLMLAAACAAVPARAQDAAAPFDGDLQRLAEILGTLH